MAQRIYDAGDKVRLDGVEAEISVLSKTFEGNGRAMVEVLLTRAGTTCKVVLPTSFLAKV